MVESRINTVQWHSKRVASAIGRETVVLGLPELVKPELLQANGGAWYLLGNIQLHVSTENDAKNYASRRHICFRVHDLTTFQQHLEAHQVSIIPDE